MNKGRVLGLLKQHGDAILVFKDGSAGLCTLDFKNKYIKKVTRNKKPWPSEKHKVLVFNWSKDRYHIFDPASIVKITPLSEVLKNG